MQRMTSLDTTRVLTEEIGARGGATEEEHKAADFISAELTRIGLTPEKQTFLGAVFAYGPYSLFAGLGLLSLVLFWQQQPVGAVAAAILTSAVLISIVLELRFRTNPLRWLLPVDNSQNMIAHIPHAVAEQGENSVQSLVITTHLDVHRTVSAFDALGGMRLVSQALAAGIASACLLLVLSVIGVFTPAVILRQIALVPGVVLLVMLGVMLLAERQQLAKGADDTAGGVATLLDLAQRLKQAPLARTDVTLVFTGSEEAGCYGAGAFFGSKDPELTGAIHIVLDRYGLAGANPALVSAESFVVTTPSDPALLALAAKVGAAHPELNVASLGPRPAHGELAVGAVYWLRGIELSSSPVGPQPASSGQIDEAALARAQTFAWEFLLALDA